MQTFLSKRLVTLLLAASAVVALTACSNNSSDPPPAALACNDSMKTAFAPDANTRVLLVRQYRAGDSLALPNTPSSPTPPVAPADVCLVKLLVGPGNPGPAGAPSTSAGIGIEVWLPNAAAWNQKIHNLGNGGWAGGAQTDITQVAIPDGGVLAGLEGSVVATSDDGHTNAPGAFGPFDASFAMKPDGTINTALWTDFAERALYEQAVKTKALVLGFYQRAQRYAYWDGCSTGGRQGYKMAQNHPTAYDGYLIGAPAINWSKFITAELYPQIVTQRDLGGVHLTQAQMSLVSGAAISSCDVVGGQHLGYLQDPGSCSYDPTRDASVLCTGTTINGVTGTNGTAACVNAVQAQAFNKIWYGMTADGSAPSPAANNGYNATLADAQMWFGLPRGTQLGALAGPSVFPISSQQVALELQQSSIADPLFLNATGNGVNGWMNLTYGQLANAYHQGVALQPFFGNINTDNPDLSALKATNAKILWYHGLGDVLIHPQGSINYYTRVANLDGGFANTQRYNRLFMIPAMGHCAGLGAESGTAGVSPAVTDTNLPLPANGQLFSALTSWVESGTAPASVTITSADTTASQLLCPYPTKPTYSGTGAITSAANYSCR